MSHLLLGDSKSTNTIKMKQMLRYHRFTDIKCLKQLNLEETNYHDKSIGPWKLTTYIMLIKTIITFMRWCMIRYQKQKYQNN